MTDATSGMSPAWWKEACEFIMIAPRWVTGGTYRVKGAEGHAILRHQKRGNIDVPVLRSHMQ